jgi:hypothetical protein
MPYQDSSYQDSTYPGDGGSTPPDPPPSNPPPSDPPPFGPPLLWDSVMSDLQIFFDDLGGPAVEHGNDQNSYYDDGEGSAPLGALFLQTFDFLTTVQNMPDAHYFDYLTNDVDPDFLLSMTGPNGAGVSAVYGGGSLTAALMSDHSTVGFTIDGLTLYGTYHPGSSTGSNSEVTVTLGYWSFSVDPGGLTPIGGAPPPPPPSASWAPSADATAARADPQGVATQEIQSDRTALHAFLDAHGGHYPVTFNGPNGPVTFDLKDFVDILDRYHVNVTDEDFRPISGGAGQVHSDGAGGWVTDWNRTELTAYETQAYHMLDFIIFHEVGHMLGIAQDFHTQMFQDAGGTRSAFLGSSYAWQSESYANNVAAAVETLIQITPPDHPAGGYTYIGHP